MKLGLHISDYSWDIQPNQFRSLLPEIARTAEQAEFDSIAVADHFWQHPIMGGPEQYMLESYSTLAYLAAHTERCKLMTIVTAAPYRHPGVLAKTVTTLDVLSGGRAWLGIGCGNYDAEAEGLGIPFPALTRRFKLVAETLEICLSMWTGEQGAEHPVETGHFRLERPLNLPQSLSRPHPPILIAGNGERWTLPQVARYGDACSLRPYPDIPDKLSVLRELCEAEGRDYDAIEMTCVFAFDVGKDGAKTNEIIEQMHWLYEMGIETVMGRLENVDQITPIEIMGRDVIPTVAKFTAD